MRHHHTGFGLALLAALVIASCSGGAAASPTAPGPSGSPGAGLEGRTFLSTAVDGRVLVAGSRITLTFRDGHIGASAGCNSMGGAYHLDGDRLVTTQLITTDMACDQALMNQDQWVADLLNGATLTLDDDHLTLAKNGVRVTLLDRRTAEPDQPLAGTRWVVDTILGGDVASSVPAGVRATLIFDQGSVAVETGCNSGGGPATVSGGSIAFGPIVLTKRGCASDVMSLEQAVTATLTGTVAYEIQGNFLTITTGGGRGLRLVAPTR